MRKNNFAFASGARRSKALVSVVKTFHRSQWKTLTEQSPLLPVDHFLPQIKNVGQQCIILNTTRFPNTFQKCIMQTSALVHSSWNPCYLYVYYLIWISFTSQKPKFDLIWVSVSPFRESEGQSLKNLNHWAQENTNRFPTVEDLWLTQAKLRASK